METLGSQLRAAIDAADVPRAGAASATLVVVLIGFGYVQWNTFQHKASIDVVGPALELGIVVVGVAGLVVFDGLRSERRLYLPLATGSVLLAVAGTTDLMDEFVFQPYLFSLTLEGIPRGLAAGCFVLAVSRGIGRVYERERYLRRQNERLDDFASVASHDLRNPLQVAHGSLAAVREEGDEESLDRLERSIDRMGTIVDDVLQFSRIGNDSVEAESVRLSEVADEAWDAIQAEEASLRVEADGELPADPRLLQQALENLFRNAMDHGGDDVTVWIGTTTDGFYVMDDGPGIDTDQRDQVFDSGYSGGTSTGLGLAIVSRIVEAHDWSIRTVTGHDGGARFEVLTD